ncbi:MAG: dihydroxyacetone kinase family protein [Microbacterium sp.]|uniref:dihydroxyacetone kinase family protein n=1 Tax=Microbacterium sp. TaxID=51671 RepID=UPI001DB803BF|nr:dihydroxyacetone kinase family protein [Microbacterium sp.]MBW8762510.1 dihydroxyacetone kinase family protein [Microbacterium sp.]
MTKLTDDPESFVADSLDGLVLSHPDILRRVDGGVARAADLPRGQVAVVVGGGSGHYPGFAGAVGEGMAAAAVCGNIFSSPSTAQAIRVVNEVEADGGVLFSYGNYAGDVIHFGEAQRRLREQGIDVRTVLVTDDIASAPSEQRDQRRGIAGDLCVFRIAGASASRGDSLDDVERLAALANDRTRSLGVAFSGCTLPGAQEPLFRVPEGMMSIGLGIHGEPGIRDVPIEKADRLALTLLGPLLDERPDGASGRVALLVNGLGAITAEELFVLFAHVHAELTRREITVVAPICGDLVTSLDMGGVSITLMWLDDELEELWCSPVRTAALARGDSPTGEVRASPRSARAAAAGTPDAPARAKRPASAESVACAHSARVLLHEAKEAIASAEESLGALDAIAGDGDHGVGMLRGLEAAVAAAADVDVDAGIGELLAVAGEAWADRAGGTSGALWGAALAAFGAELDASPTVDASTIYAAVDKARGRLVELGGAEPGDKTMLDALLPFERTLASEAAGGSSLPDAIVAAAQEAQRAAEGTAALSPRRGRARPLAERSIGHPDPGAVSFALIMRTVAESSVTDQRSQR